MEFKKKSLYNISLLKFVRPKPYAYIIRLTGVNSFNSSKKFLFRRLSRLWRVNIHRRKICKVRFQSKSTRMRTLQESFFKKINRSLKNKGKFKIRLNQSQKKITRQNALLINYLRGFELLFVWKRFRSLLKKNHNLSKRLWEWLQKGSRPETIFKRNSRSKKIQLILNSLVKQIKFIKYFRNKNLITQLDYQNVENYTFSFVRFQNRTINTCRLLWNVMKSRERRLTKLRKENVNLPKFLTRKKNFVSVLEETIYALRDMSIKKRYRARIKKHYTSKGTFKKPYRNHLLKYSMKVARRQRKRNRRRRRLRKFGVGLKYNKGPLLNLLKRKVKFQLLEKDNFKKSRVYFKYTGSNIFLTITNSLGEVAFVYSAGIFKNSHTRKEKTTIFMAQQLGELLSVRIYKTNAKEIFFILFINHTKARVLVKFFMRGVKAVNRIKFNKVIFKRRVMRNGVRLAKPRRK